MSPVGVYVITTNLVVWIKQVCQYVHFLQSFCKYILLRSGLSPAVCYKIMIRISTDEKYFLWRTSRILQDLHFNKWAGFLPLCRAIIYVGMIYGPNLGPNYNVLQRLLWIIVIRTTLFLRFTVKNNN